MSQMLVYLINCRLPCLVGILSNVPLPSWITQAIGEGTCISLAIFRVFLVSCDLCGLLYVLSLVMSLLDSGRLFLIL